MMGTTHALVGLLIGSSSIIFAPEMVLEIALASYAGGLFPDFDMPFKHRKTLHFPAYYSLLALISAPIALIIPSVMTAALFYFLLSAAVHCWSEVLGGGLEPKPWKMTSDESVYLHAEKRWLQPRYIIRYDGAPEDFGLAVLTGILCLITYEIQTVHQIVYISLAASLIYSLVRKKIPEYAPEKLLKTF